MIRKGSKTDGMELRSGNSITHFPEIYDSQFGPVCDEGEQEVASVLLALSRSASMGNRCSKCRLEEHLCLCLSTSNHNSAGSEKGTTATVHSDIDCPIGTQTVMVPQSAGTSHRLSKEATSARKDVNAKKGSSRSRRSRKSKPCGLENIRVSEPTPRFSKRARDYIKVRCSQNSTNQPKLKLGNILLQTCECSQKLGVSLLFEYIELQVDVPDSEKLKSNIQSTNCWDRTTIFLVIILWTKVEMKKESVLRCCKMLEWGDCS